MRAPRPDGQRSTSTYGYARHRAPAERKVARRAQLCSSHWVQGSPLPPAAQAINSFGYTLLARAPKIRGWKMDRLNSSCSRIALARNLVAIGILTVAFISIDHARATAAAATTA